MSNKANRNVSLNDRLFSSKQIEVIFNRSSAWVWMHFQKNKNMKQRAIYIRSRPYWLESDINKDKDLSKYLELVNQTEVQGATQ